MSVGPRGSVAGERRSVNATTTPVTLGKTKLGHREVPAAEKEKGRAFTRSSTAQVVVRRSRADPVPSSMPPPPAMFALHEQRKKEAATRAAGKRAAREAVRRTHTADRSRSPALRVHSPAHPANGFSRSASGFSPKTASTHSASPLRGSSPATPGKLRAKSPMLRSPSPQIRPTNGVAKGKFSMTPAAGMQAGRDLLGGISKSLMENFGIEPEDLKIDTSTVLGTGGFGTVYIGDYQATEVAVKVHNTERSWTPSEIQEWKREVSIMTKLRHPNILMLLGAVFYKTKLAIVTELCEKGTLLRLLQSSKADNEKITWGRKVEWLRQIAKGMAFLHHKRIFHRDLKAANVFVTGETMKIADFGLSRIRKDILQGLRAESMGKDTHKSGGSRRLSRSADPINRQEHIADNKENSRIQGTFAFIAPEIWSETPYSEKVMFFFFWKYMGLGVHPVPKVHCRERALYFNSTFFFDFARRKKKFPIPHRLMYTRLECC